MKSKKFLVVSAAISSLLAFSINAYAADEWVRVDEGWQYYNQSNQLVTSDWYKSEEGLSYYLGSDSIMLQSQFVEIDNDLYYFNSNGSMAVNQWQQIATDAGTHWYYFGEDGIAYTRVGRRFKKEIGDDSYIFDEYGRMLTGWIDNNGNVVEDSVTAKFVEGIYYADESTGKLYVNRWFNFYDAHWHDGLRTDLMGTDYAAYDELWFNFGADGKKLKSNGSSIKQIDVDGKTYGFDEYGVMAAWWVLTSTVATDSNAKFYYGRQGGELLRDMWVWTWPSIEQDQEQFEQEEASWFRADETGRLLKNRIQTINGKKYAFDELGRMQTGFVFFRDGFVGQFNTDTFSSDDFRQGILWGFGENADLYLASIDELNDGSLQMGFDIKVELSDGTFSFGFDSKGRALGRRNTLRKANNSYYISGFRLDADPDDLYGVIYDAARAVYKVVDVNGKLVEGNRRVVQNASGDWLIIVNGEFKAKLSGEHAKPRWYNDKTTGLEGFHAFDSSQPVGQRYSFITNKDYSTVTSGLSDSEKLFGF